MGISTAQKTPDNFKLFQARQQFWKVAERWQLLQLAAVVALPIGAAIYGLVHSDARPIIATGAALLTLFDATYIDRSYRAAIRRAAKASEHFDLAVYQLPWNRLAAGNMLEPEELNDAACDWRRNHPADHPTDWYPPEVDRVPLPVARVICQRINVNYDSDLRRRYAGILGWMTVLIVIAVGIYGFVWHANLTDLLVGMIVPIAPLLVFAIRDAFRQRDAANANDLIRDESGRVLDEVINRKCGEPECEAKSLQMQAAIYGRRATNPLILPGIYRLFRSRLEKRMGQNADHWVRLAEQAAGRR
jgi:hypothetical protein